MQWNHRELSRKDAPAKISGWNLKMIGLEDYFPLPGLFSHQVLCYIIVGVVAPDNIPHNPKKHHLNLITNFPGMFFSINSSKRWASWTFEEMMVWKYRGKNSWGSSTYTLLKFHIPLIANETSIRNHEKYGNHLHSAKPFQVICPDTESIHSTRLTHSRSLRGEVIEFFVVGSFGPYCVEVFF